MEPSSAAPIQEPVGATPQDQVAPTTMGGVNQTPQIEKPKKSSKALIWVLAILAVISIAAAGVFAYLYFTTPTAPAPVPEEDTSKETPAEETAEETEITDAKTKQNLDNQIAILYDVKEQGPHFIKYAGATDYTSKLNMDGDLDETYKIAHIIHTLEDNFRLLTDAEKEAAVKQAGYVGEEANWFKNSKPTGIDASLVAAKYLEIFGKTPRKVSSEDHCYGYQYNEEHDIFYNDSLGCGGTSDIIWHYFKNSYTTKGNEAYVYTYAGTEKGGDEKVYCDIINFKSTQENYPSVCASINPTDSFGSFVIDESNYKNFAQYRFIFEKSADDNTYYFVKVEKL